MSQSSVMTFTKEEREALFQTLLVAYDFSEAAETALQYAITVARRFGSFVTVVSIQSAAQFAVEMDRGPGQMRHAHRELTADLQQVAEKLSAQGIRNRVIHRAGAVGDVLIQVVAECKADLLFMGAYGHKGIDRPRLGSTAEYMLRSTPCAVFTIGPGAILHDHGVSPLRVLLYASSLPRKIGHAGELIIGLAKKIGARIEIIHVVDNQAEVHETRSRAEMRSEEEALAQDLRQKGVDAIWKLASGPQGEQIVERANQIHADLIVFGLEHRSKDPDVMGTISTTIWQAPCPVLTVPGPA